MILFADTNILIDAQKVDVYKNFLQAEDEVFMESSMLVDEVKSPSGYANELISCGLKIFDMTDDEFVLATEMHENDKKLSFYDCVAYAVSKSRNWILVTGDNRLRKTAERDGITVHGFIWVLQQCDIEDDERMMSILKAIIDDSAVRLPKNKLLDAFPHLKDRLV